MKKFLFLLVSVFAMQTAIAGNELPIKFEQLPKAAQEFVKKHFPERKVAFATVEKKYFGNEYDLMLDNGDKLEFNKNGEWQEVKCKTSGVPSTVIPEQINRYVAENYPDAKVLKIERERHKYEVKLSNRWEIKFTPEFQVYDVDYDD